MVGKSTSKRNVLDEIQKKNPIPHFFLLYYIKFFFFFCSLFLQFFPLTFLVFSLFWQFVDNKINPARTFGRTAILKIKFNLETNPIYFDVDNYCAKLFLKLNFCLRELREKYSFIESLSLCLSHIHTTRNGLLWKKNKHFFSDCYYLQFFFLLRKFSICILIILF